MYIEKSECPFFAKGIQLILYVKVIYANNNVLACVVHSYTIYVEIDLHQSTGQINQLFELFNVYLFKI